MLKYNNNGGQNDVVVGSSSSNGGVVGIPPGIILLPGTGGGCKCVIRLLDDAEVIECEIQPRCKAQYLLDYVCQQLDVLEKDYFGLRYVDHHKQRKWFDFSKSIANQVKDVHNLVLCFRVKFYPPDPTRLQEATRYQLYLQLKRDLQHGRLYSPGPGHDLAFLAALCLQEELGDYDPDRHLPGYVSEMNLVLNQSEKLEAQIEDFHSGKVGSLPGVSATQAVNAFLRRAASLETYGIDPHPVKDPKGARLYLGTNHSGVSTFHNGRRTHHFRWVEISKLNYEGRMFIIHIIIMEDSRTKKKHTVGFKCATSSACRQLWRYSVEQRIFFTFSSSADIPAVVTGGSFFSRGSKVRYSGRVERELSEEIKFPSAAGVGGSVPSARRRVGEVNSTVAAAAAALMTRGVTSASLNVGAGRNQRVEAFAARRSASEPVNHDYDDDEGDYEEEEEEEDLSFASSERMMSTSTAKRRREEFGGHRQGSSIGMGRTSAGRHHHHLHHGEDGSTASASTKTSSLFQEGHDSYEASSCGSDDRSDVASWVALDLGSMRNPVGLQHSERPLHHRSQQQHHPGHSREPSNGYDDRLTIDSTDFYGYVPSQTGSMSTADAQHWTPGHHAHDGHLAGFRGRHSASPAHYISSSRYREDADGWTDSIPRRRRAADLRDHHHHHPPAVIPLPGPGSVAAAPAGPAAGWTTEWMKAWSKARTHCRAWTKRILLLGTSFVTAFSIVALTLILVYETDFHWAIHVRHWPEMAFIQRHLYMPLRSLFPL